MTENRAIGRLLGIRLEDSGPINILVSDTYKNRARLSERRWSPSAGPANTVLGGSASWKRVELLILSFNYIRSGPLPNFALIMLNLSEFPTLNVRQSPTLAPGSRCTLPNALYLRNVLPEWRWSRYNWLGSLVRSVSRF